jgi:hypothetical protein
MNKQPTLEDVFKSINSNFTGSITTSSKERIVIDEYPYYQDVDQHMEFVLENGMLISVEAK